MWKFLLFFLLLFLFSCKNNPEEPTVFDSYEQVENYLSEASFKIDETTKTGESEWINSAHYQSKDGDTGFLTLEMRRKPYYFQKVPLTVWEGFKAAKSKGTYFHQNIKNQYSISLNGNTASDTQCKGTTKKGKRCKRNATESGYCFQHSNS